MYWGASLPPFRSGPEQPSAIGQSSAREEVGTCPACGRAPAGDFRDSGPHFLTFLMFLVQVMGRRSMKGSASCSEESAQRPSLRKQPLTNSRESADCSTRTSAPVRAPKGQKWPSQMVVRRYHHAQRAIGLGLHMSDSFRRQVEGFESGGIYIPRLVPALACCRTSAGPGARPRRTSASPPP